MLNLATRCAACGTVFRVATEQLRACEGWVRCGRCNAVFDASLALIDLELGEPVVLHGLTRPTTGDPQPPSTGAPGVPGAANASASTRNPDPLSHIVPVDWHEHQQRKRAVARAAATATAVTSADSRTSATAPDARPGALASLLHARSADDAAGAGSVSSAPDSGRREPALVDAPSAGNESALQSDGAVSELPADGSDAALADAQPSFVRSAERAAFWRRPGVRLAQGAAALALAAAALLQAALLWRNPLAAQLPALSPLLQVLCMAAGCRVEPPRRLDQLSVDGSGLTRVDGSPLHRLQVLLRNRADTLVLVPALDLTLTDNQGRLIARRVLSAADLGLRRKALEPGQELPIRVLLSTGEQRVDGYTLELFYP